MLRWASDTKPDQPRVFWLHGMGGEGKSTIAATVARILEDERKCLGATFFFSRDVAARSRPDNVFSTIAFQLSSRHPAVATAVSNALKDNPNGYSTVTNQFYVLLKNPMDGIRDALGKEPIVVIFDGLDECGTEDQRKDLLKSLKEISKFPPVFKFFFSSRPEQDIKSAFDSMTCHYDLSAISKDTITRDILMFAQKSLADLAIRYPGTCGTPDWQGPEMRQGLVKRAAGLFIWVSTAVKFIGDCDVDDPEARREVLFSSNSGVSIPGSPSMALNSLYLQVVGQAFPSKASQPRQKLFKDVIGTVLLVEEPLSLAALGSLLGLGQPSEPNNASEIVYEAVSKLQSVLHIPDIYPESQPPLRIIHPSFADFLTNPDNEPFFIDRPAHHSRLARLCLLRMQASLRSDICQIDDPTKLNSDVENLDIRLAKYVPADLCYACIFWVKHVEKSDVEDHELCDLVQRFLFNHLIDWVEILSLLQALDDVLPSIKLLSNWIEVRILTPPSGSIRPDNRNLYLASQS